jgi:hypothetical protein
MVNVWMDLEGIIHDLFEVCLHLPRGTKKTMKKPRVIVGSIMGEFCTGHLLRTNPSVTAPRTCLISCLLCASALFIKLFILQYTFHFLSIAWSNTEYLNLPYGFYKFRSTPFILPGEERRRRPLWPNHHKKAYNWDKPIWQ